MTTYTLAYYFANFNDMSPHSDHEVGAVCIPNISRAERQKRLNFGIRQFIFTLVILAVMIVLGVNHFWRLPLLLMFWAAGASAFQAFDKT